MLLQFLELWGRKRIIADRGPSHPYFAKAKPWISRYYLLLRQRPKWFPFNVFLHEMLDNDHGDGVHNHACPFIAIVLGGTERRSPTVAIGAHPDISASGKPTLYTLLT